MTSALDRFGFPGCRATPEAMPQVRRPDRSRPELGQSEPAIAVVIYRLDDLRAVQPAMEREASEQAVLARLKACEPTRAAQVSRVFCG